ncbi:unnamed protein product [Amoebophrya sp. A25]|nr:unnamed protein product [Amoebophrya sp. A25]|eukprot:GSA25T00026624001.1
MQIRKICNEENNAAHRSNLWYFRRFFACVFLAGFAVLNVASSEFGASTFSHLSFSLLGLPSHWLRTQRHAPHGALFIVLTACAFCALAAFTGSLLAKKLFARKNLRTSRSNETTGTTSGTKKALHKALDEKNHEEEDLPRHSHESKEDKNNESLCSELSLAAAVKTFCVMPILFALFLCGFALIVTAFSLQHHWFTEPSGWSFRWSSTSSSRTPANEMHNSSRGPRSDARAFFAAGETTATVETRGKTSFLFHKFRETRGDDAISAKGVLATAWDLPNGDGILLAFNTHMQAVDDSYTIFAKAKAYSCLHQSAASSNEARNTSRNHRTACGAFSHSRVRIPYEDNTSLLTDGEKQGYRLLHQEYREMALFVESLVAHVRERFPGKGLHVQVSGDFNFPRNNMFYAAKVEGAEVFGDIPNAEQQQKGDEDASSVHDSLVSFWNQHLRRRAGIRETSMLDGLPGFLEFEAEEQERRAQMRSSSQIFEQQQDDPRRGPNLLDHARPEFQTAMDPVLLATGFTWSSREFQKELFGSKHPALNHCRFHEEMLDVDQQDPGQQAATQSSSLHALYLVREITCPHGEQQEQRSAIVPPLVAGQLDRHEVQQQRSAIAAPPRARGHSLRAFNRLDDGRFVPVPRRGSSPGLDAWFSLRTLEDAATLGLYDPQTRRSTPCSGSGVVDIAWNEELQKNAMKVNHFTMQDLDHVALFPRYAPGGRDQTTNRPERAEEAKFWRTEEVYVDWANLVTKHEAPVERTDANPNVSGQHQHPEERESDSIRNRQPLAVISDHLPVVSIARPSEQRPPVPEEGRTHPEVSDRGAAASRDQADRSTEEVVYNPEERRHSQQRLQHLARDLSPERIVHGDTKLRDIVHSAPYVAFVCGHLLLLIVFAVFHSMARTGSSSPTRKSESQERFHASIATCTTSSAEEKMKGYQHSDAQPTSLLGENGKFPPNRNASKSQASHSNRSCPEPDHEEVYYSETTELLEDAIRKEQQEDEDCKGRNEEDHHDRHRSADVVATPVSVHGYVSSHV